MNLIKADKKSISDVLIIPMTENKKAPLELATSLRNLGINTEIYLNNKKIKAKMKYADKLEIPYVIVIGDDEIANNTVKVKNMETGEEKSTDFNAESVNCNNSVIDYISSLRRCFCLCVFCNRLIKK